MAPFLAHPVYIFMHGPKTESHCKLLSFTVKASVTYTLGYRLNTLTAVTRQTWDSKIFQADVMVDVNDSIGDHLMLFYIYLQISHNQNMV